MNSAYLNSTLYDDESKAGKSKSKSTKESTFESEAE